MTCWFVRHSNEGVQGLLLGLRAPSRAIGKGQNTVIEAGNRAVLVAAVVEGRSLREVAAMAGVSVSTVQRRLKEPEVIEEIRQQRRQQRQELLGRFAHLRTACVSRLTLLVDDPDGGIALRAISLVLATSNRIDLAYDLEERLAALEQPSPGDEDEGSVEGGDDNVD